MRCVDDDCTSRGHHRHHIVEKQELKRRWKYREIDREQWPSLTRLLGDPRNLIHLCSDHHFAHHDGGRDRIYIMSLPEEALEFAFAALGPFAFDYLKRYYCGPDPRLESYLARAS